MTKLRAPQILFALTLLSGCAPFHWSPPPYDFELWERENASQDEIKRALLECGYPDPFHGASGSANDNVLRYRCMWNSGFRPKYVMCGENMKDIQACQASVNEIPVRDVKRRLNSEFCRKFPKAEEVCK